MPQPSREARPRHRAAGTPILAVLAAGLIAVPFAVPANAQSPGAGQTEYRLARAKVPLQVQKGRLGPWRPLLARDGAKLRFLRSDRGRVLRLADQPRRAGYVAVSAVLGPRTIVTERVEVNLTRQRLRRGKVRSLLAVTGRDGTSYQAGVMRTRRGRMVWAVWIKSPRGQNMGIRTGGRARLGRWHSLELRTRWASPRSGARLRVDGRIALRTPSLDRRAVAGERAIIGLGRVSKRTETGALLVRAARVSAARPVPVRAAGAPAPAPAPPPAALEVLPGAELARGDYETGSISQWNASQRVASDRIQVIGSPARQGRYAARFEVRNGDNPIGFGDRAEVQMSTREDEGQERWYAWSTLFDANFPDYSTWQVVSQWHANADGSPPIGFFAQGDDLLLKIHRHSGPGSLINIVDVWRGPLNRGQWLDIKLHIKWSGDDAVGFVELWVNGVRQTFDDGSQRRYIRTLYPGVGAYFKQGLYRESGLPSTGIVYHDAFRMSAG